MERGEVPDFLTVAEAARVLRIGRTAAYRLTVQWRATDGREGLPVVIMGRSLRVPRAALEKISGGPLTGDGHSPRKEEPAHAPPAPENIAAASGAPPRTTRRRPPRPLPGQITFAIADTPATDDPRT
jgi:hypothetical protein